MAKRVHERKSVIEVCVCVCVCCVLTCWASEWVGEKCELSEENAKQEVEKSEKEEEEEEKGRACLPLAVLLVLSLSLSPSFRFLSLFLSLDCVTLHHVERILVSVRVYAFGRDLFHELINVLVRPRE